MTNPITPETVCEALKEATPGPWRWEISLASKRVELSGDGGDLTVMDFVRWGMSGAAARFWRWSGKPRVGHPTRSDGLAIPAPGREHHANWYRIIDDPNARLIAMAPDLARAYLAAMEENARMREAADEQIMAHPTVVALVKVLEWYGERNHWRRSEVAWSSPCEAVRDKGDRARAVLGDLKGVTPMTTRP